MSALPYFKFYASDWTSGVQGLTLEERGAYITLLAYSWLHGPLPTEKTRLATLLGVSGSKFGSLWRTLSDYWTETEVGWINERLEAERAELAEKHEGLAEAGKKGAEKRWAAYRLANAQANGVANGQAIDPATGEVIG